MDHVQLPTRKRLEFYFYALRSEVRQAFFQRNNPAREFFDLRIGRMDRS
jgi:hypothetical protein